MKWSLPFFLLLTASAMAEEAKAPAVELLKTLNEAYLKKDAETMKRHMSADHVAILSSGTRQNRDEHLRALADLKLTKYTMADVQVLLPSKDTALITYTATVQGTYQGKELPGKIAASSVWAWREGKWLEVFYQETPLPK